MIFNTRLRVGCKMKITKKEILEKFSKDEMADLLVGANERYNTDKGLIEYLFARVKDLEEQIKEMKKCQ